MTRNPGDPAYDPPREGLGMGGAPHHRALNLLKVASRVGLLWSHREARGKTILLPLGSLEDRPWGPSQLDTLIAVLVAVAAAGSARECLVAPPLPYGYSPMHRAKVELPPQLLEDALQAILRGFTGLLAARRVVVVDGHYGHRDIVERVARSLGAGYCNVWGRIIEEYGLESFEQQLRVEKKIVEALERGLWPRELDTAVECVESLCSSLSSG